MDNTNSRNFHDASSSVDPRTGTFTFSITLGFIVTHSRRFAVKLTYNHVEAFQKVNKYALGPGWMINIPWMGKKEGNVILKCLYKESAISFAWVQYKFSCFVGTQRLLNMGDGSKYSVRPGFVNVPLRYYDTRNINVSNHGLSGFSVRNNGDQWWLGYNGMKFSFY